MPGEHARGLLHFQQNHLCNRMDPSGCVSLRCRADPKSYKPFQGDVFCGEKLAVKIEEVERVQMVLETDVLRSYPYKLVKSSLTPLSCEAETNGDKAESDDHVPRANAWNWICSLAYVKNNDPEQADEKVGDHYRSKP